MRQGKISPIRAYIGATADGDVYSIGQGDAPYLKSTWDTFEAHAGRPMAIIQYSDPFLTWEGFGAGIRQTVHNRGAISLVSVGGGSTALVQEVAAGQKDSMIETWATKAAEFGYPFFLRPWWEMNGTWWEWGRSKLTPAEFKAAWRRLYEKVTPIAPNVTFVYCPNIIYDAEAGTMIAEQYPGDAYVDWAGFDGYSGESAYKKEGTLGPYVKFQPTYAKLQEVCPTKPILICETGCTEEGVTKGNWIIELLELPRSMPNVKGVVYFNNCPIHTFGEASGRVHWEIETSPAAEAGFKAGAAMYPAASTSTLTKGQKVPLP